jgi:hypothetical protein
LACCFVACAPSGSFAQGQDADGTYYFPKRLFKIPFNGNKLDPSIQDIFLYVSTDNGKSYQYVTQARRIDNGFRYQANADGHYMFATQTRDQGGRLTPADARNLQPNMRVCVDTKPPVITVLRQVTSRDNSPVAIEWNVEDENFLDIRAYYRSVNGGEWIPLLLPEKASGEQGFKPAVPGELELSLQAIDKAKNQATPRSVRLKPAAPRPGMPPPESDTAKVLHVKSKTFKLEYELDQSSKGPSGVARVDLWKIQQGGRWQKCEEVGKPPETSVTVTVSQSGRWGFRLIPRSGVGLAAPDPVAGDAPDIWVEVDDKAPQVRITNIVVGQGAEAGNLTVSWTASDTYLRARPITISYAIDPQGSWKVVAAALENSGHYTFKPLDLDPQLFKFYVKVTAIDEAGNVGEDQWREAVKVDLKIPRIKNISVKISEARETSLPSQDRQPPLPPFGSGPTPATPTGKKSDWNDK